MSIKHILSTIGLVCFLFLAVGSTEDSKSSSGSSSKSSSSSKWDCGWCGGNISGRGYNTIMRQINQPANEYSHYCSRGCATSFLRAN